jgi:hypothetical protein
MLNLTNTSRKSRAMVYKQKIIEQISQMNESQQMRVLDFFEQLQYPKGLSGAEAIRIAKEIDFDSESLREMQRAIEDLP